MLQEEEEEEEEGRSREAERGSVWEHEGRQPQLPCEAEPGAGQPAGLHQALGEGPASCWGGLFL